MNTYQPTILWVYGRPHVDYGFEIALVATDDALRTHATWYAVLKPGSSSLPAFDDVEPALRALLSNTRHGKIALAGEDADRAKLIFTEAFPRASRILGRFLVDLKSARYLATGSRKRTRPALQSAEEELFTVINEARELASAHKRSVESYATGDSALLGLAIVESYEKLGDGEVKSDVRQDMLTLVTGAHPDQSLVGVTDVALHLLENLSALSGRSTHEIIREIREKAHELAQ